MNIYDLIVLDDVELVQLLDDLQLRIETMKGKINIKPWQKLERLAKDELKFRRRIQYLKGF